MAMKRLHISLTASQFKLLEKLAAKLGLDRSSALSYCIARVAEQEGINGERSTGARK